MRIRVGRQRRSISKGLQSSFKCRARSRSALVFGLLIGCSALAFAVRAYSRRVSMPGVVGRENLTAPVLPPVATAFQSASPAEPMQAEIITIRPYGFEPQKIERPPGRFILNVDNRSGLSAVALRLDHNGAGRLRAVQVPREKLDWIDSIDLLPGSYLLTEADHPDWVCHITIIPK
jgi:hypothetical protein